MHNSVLSLITTHSCRHSAYVGGLDTDVPTFYYIITLKIGTHVLIPKIKLKFQHTVCTRKTLVFLSTSLKV